MQDFRRRVVTFVSVGHVEKATRKLAISKVRSRQDPYDTCTGTNDGRFIREISDRLAFPRMPVTVSCVVGAVARQFGERRSN